MRKKKILLVDDLPFDILLTKRALQECSVEHDIDIAEDGLQALVRLHEAEFDLVVLDLKMPKVNGVEALRFLRSSRMLAHIPVIVQSGSALEVDRRVAEELGTVEYVHKAMDYDEYRHNLRQALSRQGYC